TLAALKTEGKVRWIGVSNFQAAHIMRAEKIAPVTSLQPPYSIIRRQIEAETLPYCKKQGIGVISYAPMASGLLTGAMTRQRAAALPPAESNQAGRHRLVRLTFAGQEFKSVALSCDFHRWEPGRWRAAIRRRPPSCHCSG